MPAELPCPDDQSLERFALGHAAAAEIHSLTRHPRQSHFKPNILKELGQG